MHMTPTRRPALVALAAALLALLVLVPAGAAHAEDQASTAQPPGKGWVRVGHFVPGMGSTSVDLTLLDDEDAAPITLAGDATYGQVSSYETLTPGSYTATVRETSATPGAEPMLSRSFEITAGSAKTVAIVGGSATPRLSLLDDDLTAPATDTARVRVLSASEASASITVTAVGGPVLAEGAVLGQATDYVTVPSGEWTLQLEGENADATLQQVPITAGSVYTVVALDVDSDQIQLKVVTDAASAAIAPQGGADTGLGGGADVQSGSGSSGSTAGPLGVAVLVAFGAATWLRRRRPLAVVGPR